MTMLSIISNRIYENMLHYRFSCPQKKWIFWRTGFFPANRKVVKKLRLAGFLAMQTG